MLPISKSKFLNNYSSDNQSSLPLVSCTGDLPAGAMCISLASHSRDLHTTLLHSLSSLIRRFSQFLLDEFPLAIPKGYYISAHLFLAKPNS